MKTRLDYMCIQNPSDGASKLPEVGSPCSEPWDMSGRVCTDLGERLIVVVARLLRSAARSIGRAGGSRGRNSADVQALGPERASLAGK